MLRVIFDTNIYGLLIKEKEIDLVRKNIIEDTNFIIYGFKPIRKELRDTPKTEKLGKLSKRNLLLSLYDELTMGKYLKDSIQINSIAIKFYNCYREVGGIRNWKDIHVDFTIVACASFYKLDVVVSDDSRTMFSKSARKAYKHITLKEGLWHPNFWKYSDLKTKYNF